MTRSFLLLVPWFAWTIAGGCATASRSNPFAATRQQRSERGRDSKKELASKPAGKTSRDESSAEDHGIQPVSGTEERHGKSAAFEHDDETLAYINKELKDASPDERESLLKELRGVGPEMVRSILRTRRMSLNYHQQNQVAENQTDIRQSAYTGTTIGHTNPVPSGSLPPAKSRDTNVMQGLGTHPWEASHYPRTTSETDDWNAADSRSGLWDGPANRASTSGPVNHANNWNGVQPGNLTTGVNPPGSNGSVQPTTFGKTDRYGIADASVPQIQPAGYHDAAAGSIVAAQQPGGYRPQTPQNTWNDLKPGQYADNRGQPVPSTTGYPIQQTNYSANNGHNASNGMHPPVGQASGQVSGPANGQVSANGVRSQTESAWADYLHRLVSLTESEIALARPGASDAEKHAYVEKQVYLRMLYLMAGRQERALQAIPGLEPADQEFWQQTLWGIANYFDAQGVPLPADRASQTVTQLTAAISRLQEKANLELKNVAFCQRISNFGNYERYARDEFSPGQVVLVYAEISNFHGEVMADGQFRTVLKSTIEIHKPGAQGEVVERYPMAGIDDTCRSRRHDYFNSYEFTMPARLALGPHVLKLTVEDQLSRKVATYSLNFTVK